MTAAEPSGSVVSNRGERSTPDGKTVFAHVRGTPALHVNRPAELPGRLGRCAEGKIASALFALKRRPYAQRSRRSTPHARSISGGLGPW